MLENRHRGVQSGELYRKRFDASSSREPAARAPLTHPGKDSRAADPSDDHAFGARCVHNRGQLTLRMAASSEERGHDLRGEPLDLFGVVDERVQQDHLGTGLRDPRVPPRTLRRAGHGDRLEPAATIVVGEGGGDPLPRTPRIVITWM